MRESREDKLVGHLHAVVTSWSIAARREKLIAAFTEIANDKLQVFPGPPPEEYKAYTKRFVNQTLLRRISLVLSRSRDSDAKRDVALGADGAVFGFLAMVNGDIRVARCHHYESGCCGDYRATVVANFVQACVDVGMFGDRVSCVPAKTGGSHARRSSPWFVQD